MRKVHDDQVLERNLNKREIAQFKKWGFGPKKPLAFQNVVEAFQKNAAKFPNDIALEHEGRQLTYLELDQYSEQVAGILRLQKVNAQENVGLFLERSIEMVIGMLAILKVGAAYVPQDIRLSPMNLLESIVEDAEIETVLSVSKFATKRIAGCKTINLNEIDFHKKNRIKRSGSEILLDGGCFILFTSGTTGRPNGVKITHRNFSNLLSSDAGSLGVRARETVSQLLNISFDMASWEVFVALTRGAKLLIRGVSLEQCARKADVIIATPGILGNFDISKFQNTRVVAVAGETCPLDLAKKWAERATFFNACGPTEICVINSICEIKKNDEEVSVGKPLANTSVYILDQELQPCKLGQVGEIWVGGIGVSEGYLNRETLNKERFKADPFRGHGKMFRTRDLGRWNSRGKLIHLGRTDDQVKIKGFRVELEAISTVLEKEPSCQASVSIKLDSHNLVSFVKPISAKTQKMVERVKEELPYFYEPTQIIALNTFPLTDRGKVDRKQLALIAANELNSQRKKQKKGIDSHA